ncbi:SEC-C metal-binding domain-containing protein [Amphibacillus sp. Q70]|uniref:SEC-C metal-binding domain-containing protein n=1 Tax=Amphibacillus sp. Q70 TaxID=3453416 RepID=UPI003F842758
MDKVRRNDPCPCGSGLKYKKCHGASNVIEMNPERYNTELEQLHSGLIDFAINEYESELGRVIEKYHQPSIFKDDELMNLYISGLTAWSILQQPLEHDETIFDIYYKKKQKKIKNERVKKIFASWSNSSPSFYKIVSINQDDVLLEDVRTKHTYNISMLDGDEFEEGNMLMGILIPFINEHEFLLSVFEVFDVNQALTKMAEKLSDDDMIERFPEILVEALTLEMTTFELEWDNPLYDKVAVLFEKHTVEKEGDEGTIKTGQLIWKLFTEKASPTFKKPEAYAAALEYIIQHVIFNTPFQTQKELAEEYHTTSATVSKNVRNITETLETELNDIIDELISLSNDEEDNFEPMMTEKMMRDIQKLLNEQEFETEEEAQQFLDQLLNDQEFIPPVSTSPRDLAQDKLYEASQTEGTKRKKLIKEALEIYPNSPDAYLLMAQDVKSPLEQYQFYYQAVIAGKKDLGEAFFEENAGQFWLMTETRPYMRAKAELAFYHAHYGDKTIAITEFNDLLSLNPNDNQGIRYPLLTLYIEEEDYLEAENLIVRYADDKSASFLFNQALIYYFKDGLTAKTKNQLKKADQQNPYVKNYLTGKTAMPKRLPDHIGFGDQAEAVMYTQENSQLWEKVSPLLNELADM